MCRLILTFVSCIAGLLLLMGCAATESPTATPLRYAKLLRMTEHSSHTWVEIINPWDTTQLLRQFLLVDKAVPTADVANLQARHPRATLLRTPLLRTLPQSTVHAALALQLGAERSLAGLCDAAYIVDESLKKLSLPDFGRGDQPNVERIIAAKVEACWMAPFENQRYESLQRANITVVDCADYLETTPLGRAEWMRFYGRLWGKSQLADSLFEIEAQRYEALADSVRALDKAIPTHPRVWLDLPWQSTWYAPGGRSYLAALIADAGGDYPLRSNEDAGSLPLALERAWQYGATADVLVVKGGEELPTNYADLTQLSAVYAQWPAVRSHRVWTCNTMRTPYYERTPFAPADLLREWCVMLGTLPQSTAHPMRYFHPLSR